MFGRTRKAPPRSLSPAEQLHQWDGAYKWEGEIDRNAQPQFSSGLEGPPDLLQILAGLSSSRISRKAALSVSAVLRARNVIAGISSTLSAYAYNAKTFEKSDRPFIEDPHPLLTSSFMYAMTIEDLLFEGISYWRVIKRSGKFPIQAERIGPKAVSQHSMTGLPSHVISEDHPFNPTDPIFIDGYIQRPEDIIAFVSPNPPLLVHAARAIRQAILLDQTAGKYTEDPIPLGFFTDADEDADPLDDDEIRDVLDRWAVARKERAWGYVPKSLKIEQLQWNARQIQLEEARTHAVLEIARSTGLDAEDVAVVTAGASRTYVNAQQRRLDLIDFTLNPYLTAVEQRLSKDDVLPSNEKAGFDASGFLRADVKTRMDAHKVAIESGVETVNEARATEHSPALPNDELPRTNGNGNGEFPRVNGSREVITNGN